MKARSGIVLSTMALLCAAAWAAPASRFVECETFTDYGGWVVDPHSMKRMGSSYLMAHGYGTPVKDATRIVNFAESGRYTVHVRTRDWSAEWRKGRGTPPGRFQVLVNGQPVGNAVLTWNIDLHFPDPENEAKFEEPFRSCAYHRHYGRPYAVPYRCLYARDCANLFLAGRHVSCSHVAFAAVRVMRTLGMLGEVAGMAAAVCKKRGCLPRDVYADHLDELKGLMRKGVPKLGVYHSGGCSGDNEFYHFKDTGHFPIWPNPRPMTPRVRDAIKKIGLRHRHEPASAAD